MVIFNTKVGCQSKNAVDAVSCRPLPTFNLVLFTYERHDASCLNQAGTKNERKPNS